MSLHKCLIYDLNGETIKAQAHYRDVSQLSSTVELSLVSVSLGLGVMAGVLGFLKTAYNQAGLKS